LRGLDGPAHWSVHDGRNLAKRMNSKALRGWGRANQVLPNIANPAGRKGHGR
jgi:bifunctional non-homologous end joining protein LigD